MMRRITVLISAKNADINLKMRRIDGIFAANSAENGKIYT
jgi:hypothetical protein